MEDIKYIISVLTVSFIIYGLVLIFSPGGSMGKLCKSIVGISLIAVIVLTVSRQKIDFKLDSIETDVIKEDTASVNKAVENVTGKITESNVKEYITSLLKQNGCVVDDLKVFTNISSDGGISIERVEVACKSRQSQTVKSVINSLSIHCVVTETDNEGL